ncbi:hypothetical protein [Neotabrizicola sp. sgz301269]|uniref:hypothetical protein n=1 Tax=Neotabrizicola sp. sgz301269 TaxID=3276282 RepID=UPI00377044A7
MTERIVAAAIQIEGVTISLPQPARHGQVLACASIFVEEAYRVTEVQGFITSKGRFVNRVQARQIAHMAGQDPKQTGGDHELFSEDLW